MENIDKKLDKNWPLRYASVSSSTNTTLTEVKIVCFDDESFRLVDQTLKQT